MNEQMVPYPQQFEPWTPKLPQFEAIREYGLVCSMCNDYTRSNGFITRYGVPEKGPLSMTLLELQVNGQKAVQISDLLICIMMGKFKRA
jgi:hypothetical protein